MGGANEFGRRHPRDLIYWGVVQRQDSGLWTPQRRFDPSRPSHFQGVEKLGVPTLGVAKLGVAKLGVANLKFEPKRGPLLELSGGQRPSRGDG